VELIRGHSNPGVPARCSPAGVPRRTMTRGRHRRQKFLSKSDDFAIIPVYGGFGTFV
jgi:hypothetical protein